ncbi:MAG: HutD/Ves family protein [Kiloniellales bacterium]
MLTLTRIDPRAWLRSAWKNGGGMTSEIARGHLDAGPDGDAPPGAKSDALGADGWSWRVSIAEVTLSGPFSEFPGVDRQIAVIAGAGMELAFEDGRIERLEPNLPFAFDGGERVEGRLGAGPVRDFNVMAVRGRVYATLEILDGPSNRPRPVKLEGVGLIHVLMGSCTLQVARPGSAAEAHQLGTDETLQLNGRGELSIALPRGARVALVTVEPAARAEDR